MSRIKQALAWLTPTHRRRLYEVGILIGGLLTAQGIITGTQSEYVGAILAAALGVARVNVPNRPRDGR